MRRALTQRTMTFSGGAVLLVSLIVCGLGLRLTILQEREVGGILLESQKQAAEAQKADMERFLDEREGQVLAEISSSAGSAPVLAALRQREPLLEEPFFFGIDGSITMPLIGKQPRRSLLASDEPTPVEFEKALRLAWSQAPPEDRSQAMQDIYESEVMAPQWRLRALSTLAALDMRSGELDRALDRYRTIFEEFESLLRGNVLPSHLQLVVARNECLLKAGRPQEARQLTLRALEEVRAGTTISTFEEETFFFARARALLSRGAPGDAKILEESESAHRKRRLSLATAETLRDWIFAHGELQGQPQSGEKLRRFFEMSFPDPSEASTRLEAAGARGEDGTRPVLAVWKRVPRPPSGAAPTIVGFHADLSRLETLLTDHLTGILPESRFSVRAAHPGTDKKFIPLTSLSGDRGFLSIGFGDAVWNDLVGKAQRPFTFAAVLIGLLAAILILGLLALIRGIRREMALSRMKTEFVANVSHELKTPLSLIRLFGETLLLDRVKDPQQRTKYYQIITRESERLSHLIGNVLNFASIEAGKKSYQLQPCDLGPLARETYESYRFHLDANGFTHRLEIAPDLPRVLADADAVSQAIINLLENAVKYSPQERDVTLRVHAEDGWVKVAVEDRGVGIDPEDQRRIWDGYYRTRQARTLRTRGSGLGLSLVRHIVEAHGGRVELRSSPGQGSIFTMAFPSAPSPARHPDAPAESRDPNQEESHEDHDTDRRG